MVAQQGQSDSRHVYRLSWWTMGGDIFLGGTFWAGGGLALYFAQEGWSGGVRTSDDLVIVGGCVFVGAVLCVIGYGVVAAGFRTQMVLEGTRLTVRVLDDIRSAELSDIIGYRVPYTRGASFWRLELRNGNTISINQGFAVDDAFRAFLARIKNLDE